jgi:hypothetical protein
LFCHKKNILLATNTIVCGVSCHTVLLEEERNKQTNKEIKKEKEREGRKE